MSTKRHMVSSERSKHTTDSRHSCMHDKQTKANWQHSTFWRTLNLVTPPLLYVGFWWDSAQDVWFPFSFSICLEVTWRVCILRIGYSSLLLLNADTSFEATWSNLKPTGISTALVHSHISLLYLIPQGPILPARPPPEHKHASLQQRTYRSA